MFTDTHCHLFSSSYDNILSVINSAENVGVNRFINSGADKVSNVEVINLASSHDNVYSTLGLHPHESQNYSLEDIKYIEDNIKNKKVIAIGEIGLDYFYGKDFKNDQIKLFEIQLKIAESYNLPVVIHSREATSDTISILKKYKVRGVIHSFSGSYETALEYIKMGFALGINGVITFKNSNLKQVVEKIDVNNIVLETDCPYLTPVPFRGTQNEPKFLIETAKFISNLKGISLEELASITNKNVNRIFDI